MKIISLVIALFCPISSWAIVVDNFFCKAQLVNANGSFATTQNLRFAVPRLAAQSQYPGVQMTQGRGNLNMHLRDNAVEISVGFQFDYFHALKYDAQGNLIAARQTPATGITFTYCDGTGYCSNSGTGQYPGGDPFDPMYGWPVVSINGNIAAYDASRPMNFNSAIHNSSGVRVGSIRAACSFEGTMN